MPEQVVLVAERSQTRLAEDCVSSRDSHRVRMSHHGTFEWPTRRPEMFRFGPAMLLSRASHWRIVGRLLQECRSVVLEL